MINHVFFADLCERELRLCRLTPDEVMVVVDEPTADPVYADAFMAAAVRLGATTFRVSVPRVGVDSTGERLGFPGEGVLPTGTGRTVLGSNAPAVAALAGADLIVDR